MHSLICGFVLAVMALFPGSAGEGGLNLRAWMDAYEKFLYAQMEEDFKRESETREEATDKVAVVEVGETLGADSDWQREIEAEAVLQPEAVETVQENDIDRQDADRHESCETSLVREVTPLYMVDGYVPDENLQTYLYQRLCEHGIGYFMPYAVCLIAQESTWNPMAENKNGRDKGLLQFRVEYVPWMDWRNPYQQIDYFVAQMANRAAAGCTVSEMISRHNTSDYGSYNQSYVDAVMQHSNTLVQIR